MAEKPSGSRPWAIGSAALFVLALIMGPGPGVLLINPEPDGSGAFVWGIPVVYVWAVFWFLMQALALAIAYVKVWRTEA